MTLIGATTENPAFEVNGALLSRMRVYALEALQARRDRRAAAPRTRAAASCGDGPTEVGDDAVEFLAARGRGRRAQRAQRARAGGGDRRASSTRRGSRSPAPRTRCSAGGALRPRRRPSLRHVSAWIKATRGSDPDASLYYLATMLEGGEDPRFIARRMVILASEDIGNADPQALSVAAAAAQAVEHVGLPEARFALAQAAIYLSLAPKSNAADRALDAARDHIREHGAATAPPWLRSGPRPGQEVGGYDNPHARPGHFSAQPLLPDGVQGARFYEPDEAEPAMAERLAQVRRARGLADRPGPPAGQ